MKCSNFIFSFLKSKGVDTVFMVSGGAAAHLINSVKELDINYICNYNEQACAMSAEGYARIANKPACVLVTNGPGSTNTITGVLGAYQDSIPMIIISGQVPVSQTINGSNNYGLRQLGVQECNIIDIVKPITKFAMQITNINSISYILEKAFNEATTGRQGPVWLDIPLDIQNAIVPNSEPNMDDVINLIKSAKKPILITGNGIHLSKSEEYFNKLKDLLQIPIASTWTSKDLNNDSEILYAGNFGIMGERHTNLAIQSADLLIILGSRLSIPNIGYSNKDFAPNAKKIMVDIDINELYKSTINIDIKIHADLKYFIQELISNLNNIELPNWGKWVNKIQELKMKYPIFSPDQSENKEKINSYYFMNILSQNLDNNTTVITDMGTSYTCTMQALKLNGITRLFTSSACCSMGFGLPGAIGAYFADKTKNVILIVGDGGLQMNIQELQTIIHHNIPLKIFILNNNGYLAISLMQDNLFNSNYIGSNASSGVSNPNFVALGNAYGYKTIIFNNNEELVNGISDVLNSNVPTICEINMIENQLLIPKVQSYKNENGEIKSSSLDNMFPFIDKEEIDAILNWEY